MSRGSDQSARASPEKSDLPTRSAEHRRPTPAAWLSARREWLVLPLLVLVTLFVYLPVWQAGFIWDDDAHKLRVGLQTLKGLGQIWAAPGATQQYYPVLYTFFWLEHRVWGEAALGYHLINVLFHATAAWLLFRLLRRLAVPGALFAALVFAVHPVCVESVAWISEQKNTLSTVFCLWAALLYLRFDSDRKARWYAVSLVVFSLALLSKTVTATLPAALLVLFWWKRGFLRWRQDVLPLIPWMVLAAASGAMTAWIERTHVGAGGEAFHLGMAERILVAGRAVWFYATKLVWPTNLIFIYPRWDIDPGALWQWAFPAATLVILAAWFALRRRSRTPLAVALLFVGMLFPALGFVNVFPFLYSYVADHFQYLAATVLISALAGWTAQQVAPGPAGVRRGTTLVAGGVLILLAVLTWRQCTMYRDSETLWRTTLARNPDCWMAYNNLGGDLLEAGHLDEAMANIREGLRLNPQNAAGYTNLGNALWKKGQPGEAIEQYRRAIATDPTHVPAHLNLGNALLHTGRAEDAAAEYRKVLELKPEFGRGHTNLGDAYSRMGRLADAISEYQRAIAQNPGDVEAHTNLGAVWGRQGRTDAAISEFETALQLDPGYAAARANLGRALVQTGRLEHAIEQYRQLTKLLPPYRKAHTLLADTLVRAGREQEALAEYDAALRADRNDAEAHTNLGTVLAGRGSLESAIAHFRQAVQIRPDFAVAHANLGRLLLELGNYDEAAAHFRQVLRITPASVEARRGLEIALRRKSEQPAGASGQSPNVR